MEKTIHRRIFKDDKIIGVLMGTKVENGVVITASQCALSKGDIFDKEFGKALCVRRVWSFEGKGGFRQSRKQCSRILKDLLHGACGIFALIISFTRL